MLETRGLIQDVVDATHKRRKDILAQRGSQALDLAGARTERAKMVDMGSTLRRGMMERGATSRRDMMERGATSRRGMMETGSDRRQQAGFTFAKPTRDENIRTSTLARDVTQQQLDEAEAMEPYNLEAAKIGMEQLQEQATAQSAGFRKEGLAPSRIQKTRRIEPIPFIEEMLNEPESDPLVDIPGVEPQQSNDPLGLGPQRGLLNRDTYLGKFLQDAMQRRRKSTNFGQLGGI